MSDDERVEEGQVESVSQNHPGCRLSDGLFRTNGCPLNREEDCDLCCVEAFEKWHCYREDTTTGEMLCPPEGCALGQCVRDKASAGRLT